MKFAASGSRIARQQLERNLKRLLGDLSTVGGQTALYMPLADEAAVGLGPTTEYFYPRLLDDGGMAFFRPTRESAFELNSYGIAEPILNASEPLDLRRPIIVCCPAVAVDWQGTRLGMGRGFYDRFFEATPKATRVGLVYQVQVSKFPLPVESWDQPLDWVVTDEMILRTSNRSI